MPKDPESTMSRHGHGRLIVIFGDELRFFCEDQKGKPNRKTRRAPCSRGRRQRFEEWVRKDVALSGTRQLKSVSNKLVSISPMIAKFECRVFEHRKPLCVSNCIVPGGTLSSYRLSETKEIRTLVHYHLATLKKIFSLLPSYHEKFFFVLGCACAQQVIFFFFALTSCGPPTHPGYSHAHCTCWSASVLLLLSLASQIFCGLASAFRLFCILVLDGQCTVGAWRAARSWCACCLGEPRARGSVMNETLQEDVLHGECMGACNRCNWCQPDVHNSRQNKSHGMCLKEQPRVTFSISITPAEICWEDTLDKSRNWHNGG